jgi:transposase
VPGAGRLPQGHQRPLDPGRGSPGTRPFAARLSVFRNWKRDRVNVLHWERNGFVLWQKRLEKDRLPWPEGETEDGVTRTGRELNGLLDGVDLFQWKPHASLSDTSVL